jgi:hypothetical protein
MKGCSRRRVAGLAAMILMGSMLVVPIMGVLPAQAACPDAGWHYSISSHARDRFGQIGGVDSNYNGTSSKASMTLSVSASGSVTESYSISVSASASAVIWSASVSADASIAHSRSLTFNNSITISVPAKSYGNGVYGFFKARFVGHLYHVALSSCYVDIDKGTVTYKAPSSYKGWCTWISTTGAGAQRPLNCQP